MIIAAQGTGNFMWNRRRQRSSTDRPHRHDPTPPPLTHYMEVILGIFLKGAGLADLWPHALALVALGAPLFAFAVAIFRRTLT